MSGICEGRVAIVTGAGRGIGRGHALELARQGARVVVNDLGSAVDGTGSDRGPAQTSSTRSAGSGRNRDRERRRRIELGRRAGAWLRAAIDAFGRLDVLVNNAGILRDRMLVNMTEEEWDAVIRVHLKGTFAPLALRGRLLARAVEGRRGGRRPRDQHVVDIGTVRQSGPDELRRGQVGHRDASRSSPRRSSGRYGVTVNAIAPGALTRMTENLSRRSGRSTRTGGGGVVRAVAREHRAPRHLARQRGVGRRHRSGVPRRRRSHRGREAWERGPGVDRGARWDPSELGAVVTKLLAESGGLMRALRSA